MRKFNKRERISGAEKRFNGLKKRLKGLNYNDSLDKDQQIEVAHKLHEIKSYGFHFFPNHYLFDKIDQIENILDKSQ
mgnify:CR=1 FL=1